MVTAHGSIMPARRKLLGSYSWSVPRYLPFAEAKEEGKLLMVSNFVLLGRMVKT
jgi:hypothetical protein